MKEAESHDVLPLLSDSEWSKGGREPKAAVKWRLLGGSHGAKVTGLGGLDSGPSLRRGSHKHLTVAHVKDSENC